MSMNSSNGRARTFRAIRKRRITEAKAAGVDITDRRAVKAFSDAQFEALCDRLRTRAAIAKAEGRDL